MGEKCVILLDLLLTSVWYITPVGIYAENVIKPIVRPDVKKAERSRGKHTTIFNPFHLLDLPVIMNIT
jgi:hypothetical protein